jgi:hypothetical protein
MIIIDISSSDICNDDQDKCDDVKSILRMNTINLNWFKLSHAVILLRPVLLYYAIKFDVLKRLWTVIFIVCRTAS